MSSPRGLSTFHERVPDPSEWVEYGIEWSDGVFNGPFSTLAEATAYMEDDGLAEFLPARLIRRTVEAFDWSDVKAGV